MALSKRKIRELVGADGRPPTVICYHAGISNAYLNALQYGGRANPSTAVLIRLAEVLGCRVGDFFDDAAAVTPAGAR